jgi:hypothetical protein
VFGAPRRGSRGAQLLLSGRHTSAVATRAAADLESMNDRGLKQGISMLSNSVLCLTIRVATKSSHCVSARRWRTGFTCVTSAYFSRRPTIPDVDRPGIPLSTG